MIPFGSTTSVKELSNIPHPDKSSESSMGINSCDNSNRQIITSYSGFDDWLTNFKPSDANIKSRQSLVPELTKSDDTSITDLYQELKTVETSIKPGGLGYVNLKITGLRKKVGSNIAPDQEVLLPHLPWVTSLVQLNQILQSLGLSIFLHGYIS
jgi:hypothetical protein